MSNIKIDKTDLNILNISVDSDSPTEESVSEDGTTIHTYSTGSQRFMFSVSGMTTTDAQWAKVWTKLTPLSNGDTFLFDIYSFTNIFPVFGNATGTHEMGAAAISGASEITYDGTKTGSHDVGDFIKFKNATYDKLYQITSVNTTTEKYGIFPSLREAIADNTEILYGTSIEARVRLGNSTLSYSQGGDFQTLRKYSFMMAEDYTST